MQHALRRWHTGQQESYKLLDIEYQTFKWNHSWASWLTWLPHWWWNFGYDKQWVFMWAAGFIVLFTLVSFPFINYLNYHVYKLANIPYCMPVKDIPTFFSKLYYSFIYTSAIFFKLTLKIENIEFKEKRGTFYLLLVYTLGIICLAYMANFVLQK